jgi:hypothetical protein
LPVTAAAAQSVTVDAQVIANKDIYGREKGNYSALGVDF